MITEPYDEQEKFDKRTLFRFIISQKVKGLDLLRRVSHHIPDVIDHRIEQLVTLRCSEHWSDPSDEMSRRHPLAYVPFSLEQTSVVTNDVRCDRSSLDNCSLRPTDSLCKVAPHLPYAFLK